jgi:hypothetical protein
MCTHLYLCMYIYIYIYIYTYILTYILTHKQPKSKLIFRKVWWERSVEIRAFVYLYTYVHVHTSLHTNNQNRNSYSEKYGQKDLWKFAHLCTCIHTYMYIHTYMQINKNRTQIPKSMVRKNRGNSRGSHLILFRRKVAKGGKYTREHEFGGKMHSH